MYQRYLSVYHRYLSDVRCLRNQSLAWNPFQAQPKLGIVYYVPTYACGISGTLRNYCTEESNTHHQKSTTINSSRTISLLINKNGVGVEHLIHSIYALLGKHTSLEGWYCMFWIWIWVWVSYSSAPILFRRPLTDHKTKTQAVAARHKALPCPSPSLTI